MGTGRPDKHQYYLGIAAEVAKRSTCLRRQYGAVIVKNDEIISTGYNGAARGETNCCDAGECWREAHGVPHGEQYEKCVAVHAEQNAIISASRKDMIGATMYLAGFENGKAMDENVMPCLICMRMMQNAGIARVITQNGLKGGVSNRYAYVCAKDGAWRIDSIPGRRCTGRHPD